MLCIFCIKEIIAFVQKLIIFSKQMHYTVDEEKEIYLKDKTFGPDMAHYITLSDTVVRSP